MLEVSRERPYLILGALGLGSFLSVEKSFEILNRASELGLLDIDCALSYGNGAAREIVGSFHNLGGKHFNIWEKVGLEMGTGSSGNNEAITSFPNSKHLDFNLNKILELYQTDKLYNIQLHAPLPDNSKISFLKSLKLEQEKSKFVHLGVSNHETFELKALAVSCETVKLAISSNQVHFNIAEQRGKPGIIAHSRSVNIPTVANRALARGLLAYHNTEDSLRMIVSEKTRAQHRKFESFYEGIKSILFKIADRPVSESAISWVLQQEGICAITLGVSSVAQLDSASQAIKYPLGRSILELIDFEIARRFGDQIFELPATMFDRNY